MHQNFNVKNKHDLDELKFECCIKLLITKTIYLKNKNISRLYLSPLSIVVIFRSYDTRSFSPESISATSYTSYAHSINSKVREERAKWNIFDSSYRDVRQKQDGPLWLDKNQREYDDESMDSSFSYLRGQNIPIDPVAFAEREIKRKKALELQNAIKEQLREKERMKQLARQKILEEEQAEEERLMRQFHEEQQRIEEEQKLTRTKQEIERKKEEVMKQAIEKAMIQAKLDKENRRRSRLDSGTKMNRTYDFSEVIPLNNDTHLDDNQKLEPEKSNSNINVLNHTAEKPSDEVILIGTPIKMKKKDLKKRNQQNFNENDQTEESEEDSSTVSSKRTSVKQSSEVDGRTLPVQSIIPIMPVQFANNFLGFTPTASIGNIQFVMIAQPSHMMGPPSGFNNTHPEIENEEKQNNNPNFTNDCNDNKAISLKNNIQEGQNDEKKINEQLCKLCDKYHVCGNGQKQNQAAIKDNNESNELINTTNDIPNLPHDRTFTKEILPQNAKLDVATSTIEDLNLIDDNYDNYSISTTTSKIISAKIYKDLSEIGIQTDFNGCKYCSQQDIRHIQHCSSSVVTRKEHQRYMIQRTRSEEETTTTTTTTTVVKKEKKLASLHDRPKWGVRVPTVQYLKQSERDPFYQRNRRRRFTRKLSEMINKRENDESSSSEAPSQSPTKKLSNRKKSYSSRNICTELLPIKTDKNGKVYFVREKGFIINELLRSKQNSENDSQDKILNKRERSSTGQLNNNNNKSNEAYESLYNTQNSSSEFEN